MSLNNPPLVLIRRIIVEDIVQHDRMFIGEIVERNGDMEYQDKCSFRVSAGESLQRATEEFHLNWRGGLNEDWEEEFATWDEYYAFEIDESEHGAYWSDYTLVNYPSVNEVTEADGTTKAAIESSWSGRCSYEAMYSTAELYIAEAAKYLAIEQSIPLDEAMEKTLYNLTLAG
jgi:hypothetical protein